MSPQRSYSRNILYIKDLQRFDVPNFSWHVPCVYVGWQARVPQGFVHPGRTIGRPGWSGSIGNGALR